ncbi:hypothetical protein DPMN_181296 [Dreissena polymorpha]|uniref:WAP domain-containing protein n=2 Tax=Dreissena polymorpha TaxID=45954 RepID=A0A9D4DCK3_DREPO|nr:hypothetical protein DPMN_181296 [Dreissena polymorpha]
MSQNVCPRPHPPDECSINEDCGMSMVCCLNDCGRRVCKPAYTPEHIIPRK